MTALDMNERDLCAGLAAEADRHDPDAGIARGLCRFFRIRVLVVAVGDQHDQ